MALLIASSRGSVSQGTAQKTAREKIKKARREEAREPPAALFLFFRALFSAMPPD